MCQTYESNYGQNISCIPDFKKVIVTVRTAKVITPKVSRQRVCVCPIGRTTINAVCMDASLFQGCLRRDHSCLWTGQAIRGNSSEFCEFKLVLTEVSRNWEPSHEVSRTYLETMQGDIAYDTYKCKCET